MTSLAAPFWTLFAAPSREAQAVTGPEPKPRAAPVFIHDAVIPWRGETLLLCQLRQQALDAAGDDPG